MHSRDLSSTAQCSACGNFAACLYAWASLSTADHTTSGLTTGIPGRLLLWAKCSTRTFFAAAMHVQGLESDSLWTESTRSAGISPYSHALLAIAAGPDSPDVQRRSCMNSRALGNLSSITGAEPYFL